MKPLGPQDCHLLRRTMNEDGDDRTHYVTACGLHFDSDETWDDISGYGWRITGIKSAITCSWCLKQLAEEADE